MTNEFAFETLSATDEKLVQTAAAYLDSTIDDALEIEVFTSSRGHFRAYALMCTGGPGVSAEYDSRTGTLTVSAVWSSDSAEILVQDYDGCPLLESLRDYGEFEACAA